MITIHVRLYKQINRVLPDTERKKTIARHCQEASSGDKMDDLFGQSVGAEGIRFPLPLPSLRGCFSPGQQAGKRHPHGPALGSGQLLSETLKRTKRVYNHANKLIVHERVPEYVPQCEKVCRFHGCGPDPWLSARSRWMRTANN